MINSPTLFADHFGVVTIKRFPNVWSVQLDIFFVEQNFAIHALLSEFERFPFCVSHVFVFRRIAA